METDASSNKRKAYIDILKIIAIFFVLYVHTGNNGVHHYLIEGGKVSRWVAMVIQQFSQICNDIFFLASGILLLAKDESLKVIFKKRVIKYVIIIVIFGLIQYCYNYYHSPEIGFEISTVIKLLYSSNITFSYWFLHSYLALLLILPMLRPMVRGMSEKIAGYLIVMYIVINGILSVVELLWNNQRINLDIPLFSIVIIYPILGYYLDKYWYKKIVERKLLWAVNAGGAVALGINVWYLYMNVQNGVANAVCDGLTLVLICALYGDIRLICERVARRQDIKNIRVDDEGQEAHETTEDIQKDTREKAQKEAQEKAQTGAQEKAQTGAQEKAHNENIKATTKAPNRISLGTVLSVIGKATIVIYLFNNILLEYTYFIYAALVNRITWLGATIVWIAADILIGTVISFIYELLKKLVTNLVKRLALNLAK